MQLRHSSAKVATAGAVTLAALAVAACGGKSSTSSSGSTPASTPPPSAATVALSIGETGPAASFTAPPSIPGGLVTLQLSNKGSKPHGAQLILLRGGHTAAQALKALNGRSNATPSWIRGLGGTSKVAPGQTGNAVLNLPQGHYLLVDNPGPGSSGPPAYRDLTVTAGTPGSLPPTAAAVEGAKLGKDRFTWRISGLKPGANQVTFKSGGANSLHQITAARFNPGANPSTAEIKQAVKNQGPPPFLERRSLQASAILDGGRTQVTTLDLQPGNYLLVCLVSDRDGGPPHALQGMLAKVKVG